MPIFLYGNTFTTNLGAGQPTCDLNLGASAPGPSKLYEIFIHNNAASTAQPVGIVRSDAPSVQTGASQMFPADSSDQLSNTRIATTWSTAPTSVSPVFYRRHNIGAIQGAWVIWSFMRGLVLLPGGTSLMLWNVGAITTGLFVNFTVEE